MSWLKNKFSLLNNTRYLEAQSAVSYLLDVKLLENGTRLRGQIEKQYYKDLNSVDGASKTPPRIVSTESKADLGNFQDINHRLRFVYANEFRNDMHLLRKDTKKNSTPYIVKTICNVAASGEGEDMSLKLQCNKFESSKLLITDRFFHKASGLAKLYNIQRERKIWWMRFSADPSRYFLEPFELSNKETARNRNIPNAQSISIKSRLPIGEIDVEHITLVPLNEALLQNAKDFEIYDERSKKNEIPAVIRSVINLDVATCALIFDGAANNKRENTLFLNRKLAPYQCLVASLDKDSNSDLNDFCMHISNVIHRAGLRHLNLNEYIENTSELQAQLELADKLGIPYTILVSRKSLIDGLLELRNRDTTLNETIHISDIPGYLLSIFHAN